MSNSFESRKPRAEAKVRDLAQENERLQLALREEQARHDAKVADVKAMEKRIGELRRELDTAAALHREVKARLERENTRLEKELADAAAERRGRMPLKDELAKADALNTRLQGELERARGETTSAEVARLATENTRLWGAVESVRAAAEAGLDGDEDAIERIACIVCVFEEAGHPDWDGLCFNCNGTRADHLPRTSDKSPDCNLDQAGTVGTKPEGLAAVQPDPEGRPSRSTPPEQS